MTSRSGWLSRDEQLAWRSWRRANRMVDVWIDAHMQATLGIPVAHYMILAMLSEAEGHALRMTDLAAATQLSRSRLSHAVAGLEARGWVRRRSCAHDGRGQEAVLTAAGRRAVETVAPDHVRQVRLIFDHLTSAEVTQLQSISDRIATVLAQELDRRTHPQP